MARIHEIKHVRISIEGHLLDSEGCDRSPERSCSGEGLAAPHPHSPNPSTFGAPSAIRGTTPSSRCLWRERWWKSKSTVNAPGIKSLLGGGGCPFSVQGNFVYSCRPANSGGGGWNCQTRQSCATPTRPPAPGSRRSMRLRAKCLCSTANRRGGRGGEGPRVGCYQLTPAAGGRHALGAAHPAKGYE